MEFLTEYAGFLVRILTVIVLFALVLVLLTAGKSKKSSGLSINKLNDGYDKAKSLMENALLNKKALKAKAKARKNEQKKEKKSPATDKKKVFVLDFDGDIKASAVESMRREITAILAVATKDDEVVVRLESGGGMVHSYGLAASQLQRIKDAGVSLTICVDKVAASGGYMMACVADKIIAAPFAILGSIGVVAQIPNIHRLLDKNNIDVELHTAGKFKRTLTVIGENTDEGREKFKQDLEDTHVLFKDFVASQRAVLDIESVATGETWYGSQAVENKLIDEVKTSDTYIVDQYDNANVFKVEYSEPKSVAERLGLSVLSAVEVKATGWISRVLNSRGF
ncbi:protease SohB [Marinomonas mediterranea]|uniref:protease SohB n=1 Tax=Marinomonas mediterranea TaxID=119864 RepID=UPI00234ACD90|nr:protease SohB [Marinomonas mediterranea]WCN08674.1 protease SohB [Marinomonas mediterranea]WCN12729.1 protease SohB [Marinomonas mediterranea]